MTTNVFDGHVGLVASDSRWSIQYGRYLLYVDDAQFDKIELYGDSVFMFAGKGAVIQLWKDWIRSAPTDESAMPDPDQISVSIMKRSAKSVVWTRGVHTKREGALFAGSGSIFAVPCWMANKDAKRAVGTAASLDECTGGEVKYFDFSTGQHNLQYPTANITIAHVDKAILERGMVMDISTRRMGRPPFPLKQVAASNDDGELADLKAKVANGEIQPMAPCPGAMSEWTEDEKRGLKEALSDVFGWRK